MAEEDEDVVFENSALHQHLKNVGYEESEVLLEKKNLQQELDDPECQVSSENAIEQVSKDAIKQPAQRFSRNFIYEKLHVARRQAEYKHGRLFYHHLLPNSALEAEDRSFLVNFIEDETDALDLQSVCEKSWWIRPVSVLVLLISYLIPRILFSWPVPALLSDLVILILVAFWFGPGSATYLARKYYETKCKQQVKTMNKTVDSLKSLKTTSKKAIRLIQEMELVTRGFTLVSHTAPLPWLEKGSGCQRQCLELRKVLFNTCRSLLLLSRQTTLKLIQQHQVIGEILEGGSYLAHIPLEEYGALVVSHSKEDLENATDNYSISALKAMLQLHNWYMSEMLKRVALGLLLQSNTKADSSVLTVSSDAMREMYEDLQRHLQALKLCYKIHRCAVADNDAEPEKPSHKSHASNVFTAVHSLSLHLQAALKKVQKMEETLEPLCPEDDCCDSITKSLKEKIASEFAHLHTDLDSCKDCVEEGISRLEKKEYPPKPEAQPTESDNEEDLNQKDPIPLVDTSDPIIGDPIIEDQVFEAYTDPNEIEDDMCDLELMFSEEEREQRKRERKNAKRVIRELNNRIAVKGWERNVEKRRQAGEDIDDEEPPEPVAIDAGEEDEEVDFPKKNPYASVLLEYEKQWNEMDTMLKQNSDKNEDSNAQLAASSSVAADVKDEQSQDYVTSDITTKDVSEFIEGSEGLPVSETPETDSNEVSSLGIHVGDAELQNVASTQAAHKSTDRFVQDLMTSQAEYKPDQIGDYEYEEVECSKGIDSERTETKDSENLSIMKQKLQHIPGVGFGFSANVAALATQRSQRMGLVMDTFGDSDEEEISDQT